MQPVTVKFYRNDPNGKSTVCRTELCSNVIEADVMIEEEIKHGHYDFAKIIDVPMKQKELKIEKR